VVIANNGKEATMAIATQRFDLVLMDVQMPEMDGIEATRWIRQFESDGEVHTPIVAMTAHAMKGDREHCLQAGMDDYLSKPISPELLEAKISKWLGRDIQAMDINHSSH
jgi:CheY-like chemotaxis protein